MAFEPKREPIFLNNKPTGYILRIISPYWCYHFHVSILHPDVDGSIIQAIGRHMDETVKFVWDVVGFEADRVRKAKALPIDNAEHILALDAIRLAHVEEEQERVRFKEFIEEGRRKMAACGVWRSLFTEAGRCAPLMIGFEMGEFPCFALPELARCETVSVSVCLTSPSHFLSLSP